MDLLPFHSTPELSPDYSFLEDDPFHHSFDFCTSNHNEGTETETATSWTVYLCIVDINNQCKIMDFSETDTGKETNLPFIRFLLQYQPPSVETGDSVNTNTESGTLLFPHFVFECVHDTEENDQKIRNDALLQIMNAFQWATHSTSAASPEDLASAFKGFIPMKTTGEVMMVYDFRVLQKHFQPIAEPTQTVSRRVWGIVDEIVFERSILGIPISPNICDTVRDTPILWNIWYKGREIDFPFSLLNIQYSGEGVHWMNEKMSPNREDRMMKQQSLVKIGIATDEYKYGDQYGELHLFSAKPIYETSYEDRLSYQRYAVFTVGATYILDEKYHSSLYSVREQLGGDADHEVGVNVEAEPDIDEDTDIALKSCIYFVEDKIIQPTTVWGIREISRFVMI